MLELWDYLVQFLVTAYGFCAALREYYRARRQPWFLLTCFYATFALGTLYWTLHLLLRQETPQVFYVSDLAWLASFATFENVCCLVENGAANFTFLLIRGISAGALHILCGIFTGFAISYLFRRRWLALTGTVGVLGACVGFHAIYNLLVTAQGAWRTAGYLFPSLLIAVLFLTKRLLLQRKISL